MKILTEIGWSHKPGGARRLAFDLLQAMVQLKPNHEYTVCATTPLPSIQRCGIPQSLYPPRFGIPRVIWDQFIFPHGVVPLAAHRDRADVTLFTNNYISLWGARPAAVFINDITPYIMPEAFQKVHGAYVRFYMRLAANKASRIITISEHSKQDICRVLGMDSSQVVVAPLAANLTQTTNILDLKASSTGKFSKLKPYILFVGAIHPRKNVEGLIAAFAHLKAKHEIPHRLLITGDKLWMAGHLGSSEAYRAVADDIVFTGRVEDCELPDLYGECDLFVYPSFYEGFGLPVLEAMSLGAPVVTSTVSSLPEVAGDAAVLVDPYDMESIAEGMFRVLRDPVFAAELRLRGLRRARSFSWSKTAATVLEVLEGIAETHSK